MTDRQTAPPNIARSSIWFFTRPWRGPVVPGTTHLYISYRSTEAGQSHLCPARIKSDLNEGIGRPDLCIGGLIEFPREAEDDFTGGIPFRLR